jgi:hypothetical protein
MLSAEDILVWVQVKAVTNSSEHICGGDAVQRDTLVAVELTLKNLNGRAVRCAEAPVDALGVGVQRFAELRSLFDLGGVAGVDGLQQANARDRGALKHTFERFELEVEALEAVEVIDGEEQPTARVCGGELGGGSLGRLGVEGDCELLGNANGKDLHTDKTTEDIELDLATTDLVLDPKDAAAAGEEVAGVVVQVETDEVGVEHATEDGLTHRERA